MGLLDKQCQDKRVTVRPVAKARPTSRPPSSVADGVQNIGRPAPKAGGKIPAYKFEAGGKIPPYLAKYQKLRFSWPCLLPL